MTSLPFDNGKAVPQALPRPEGGRAGEGQGGSPTNDENRGNSEMYTFFKHAQGTISNTLTALWYPEKTPEMTLDQVFDVIFSRSDAETFKNTIF